MNILVADEFPIYRYLFKSYIKRCWPNALVSEVDDVQKASLSLLVRNYDLVMLDILLPDSQKIESLIKLAVCQTKVVVFSENGINLNMMARLHKIGVNAILQKSMTSEEVLVVLEMIQKQKKH